MSAVEIVEAVLSIIASILGIIAFIKAKSNESEIKKIKQEIRDSHIENSSINQAAGDISINNDRKD